MRMTNVERASRPVHTSVGPGDPTYGVRNGVTDRSGLETRPTGRETVSQIGRVWRPDLRGEKRCHRSVGPGDPTYTTIVILLVCVSETHHRKLLMPLSE
jgi:hypothetical protein